MTDDDTDDTIDDVQHDHEHGDAFEPSSELDLPLGFDDAPVPVQMEVLESKRSVELAAAIADELRMDSPRAGALNKRHKAAILLELRDYHDAIDNDEFVTE